MITALTFEPQVSQPNCDPHYWLINRGRWGLDLLSMTFARKRLARLARGGRGVAAFRPGVWLTHTDPIHPQPRCLRLNLVNPIVFDLITVTRGGLRLFETCWGLRIGCLLSSILPLGNDLIKYWSTSGRRSFGFFLTATLQRSWFFVFSYDQDGVALRWDKLIFFPQGDSRNQDTICSYPKDWSKAHYRKTRIVWKAAKESQHLQQLVVRHPCDKDHRFCAEVHCIGHCTWSIWDGKAWLRVLIWRELGRGQVWIEARQWFYQGEGAIIIMQRRKWITINEESVIVMWTMRAIEWKLRDNDEETMGYLYL